MDLKDVKIIADSSCDLPELPGFNFESVPLKIITAEKEYTDDPALDVRAMADELQHYKGRSSTSCPNSSDWLSAFGDARYVFCITITATLSGSYNAAMHAKQLYEEEHPDRQVFVLNSLTTGPEMSLIIEKFCEILPESESFCDACRKAEEYRAHTGLIFMLESMKNLANNGRVNPIAAKAAGILGIRAVGKASDNGDLQLLSKSRGEVKALECIAEHLQALGLNHGKVHITHCFNPTAAEALALLIRERFDNPEITIRVCRGLCSFYAEKGGILIGFEKI